ncbi:MerR family transcriptional regulator [Desulfosporosinus shakirovi]|uniref:MerR family transcriptional regulator n=1 Tax=Desulfosporosinus shakirovi TaxID=2885154 RepID=UPI001E384F3B|nr:MerR family transcriptional regulator [Desulfosporosinus sp. SRJS8]MCB8814579.1 MerR family transcriptional regulator [Desulfosporosinus sp. SRJS8]
MNIAVVSKKFDLSQDTLRYYERVGMIPPVNRTPSGIRDYTEENCKWVELAKCMRSAGLPVEVMIEYLKLTQQGEETIPARRELLLEQREQLLAQKAAVESTLDRLNFKIERYEIAMETGVLSWDREEV